MAERGGDADISIFSSYYPASSDPASSDPASSDPASSDPCYLAQR
jgi:hypothetical protein